MLLVVNKTGCATRCGVCCRFGERKVKTRFEVLKEGKERKGGGGGSERLVNFRFDFLLHSNHLFKIQVHASVPSRFSSFSFSGLS